MAIHRLTENILGCTGGKDMVETALTSGKNVVQTALTSGKNVVQTALTSGKNVVQTALTSGKNVVQTALTSGKNVVQTALTSGKKLVHTVLISGKKVVLTVLTCGNDVLSPFCSLPSTLLIRKVMIPSRHIGATNMNKSENSLYTPPMSIIPQYARTKHRHRDGERFCNSAFSWGTDEDRM